MSNVFKNMSLELVLIPMRLIFAAVRASKSASRVDRRCGAAVVSAGAAGAGAAGAGVVLLVCPK